MSKRLDEKDPAEAVPLSFDFSDVLVDDLDVTKIEISIEVLGGLMVVDPPENYDPKDMLDKSPWMEGGVLMQVVKGGVDGYFYKVEAIIYCASSPEQIYKLSSVLPVRSQ